MKQCLLKMCKGSGTSTVRLDYRELRNKRLRPTTIPLVKSEYFNQKMDEAGVVRFCCLISKFFVNVSVAWIKLTYSFHTSGGVIHCPRLPDTKTILKAYSHSSKAGPHEGYAMVRADNDLGKTNPGSVDGYIIWRDPALNTIG